MNAKNLLKFLQRDQIVGSAGVTTFQLNSIIVSINDVSIVGNILQEWLEHYMKQNQIYFRTKMNSQEFPDFLLSDNDKIDLLEVKAFTKSPNFDIANFEAYARSLREHAYRLDAEYLIFKYSQQQDDGKIVIDDIWLKHVWEICSASDRAHVKIQWKQGTPVNIRPATWYSNRATFPVFQSRLEFVEALSRVIGMARIDSSIQKNWLDVVKHNYYQHTGRDL